MEIILEIILEILFEVVLFLGIDFFFWHKGKKNRMEIKRKIRKALDIWNTLFIILTTLICIYVAYKLI